MLLAPPQKGYNYQTEIRTCTVFENHIKSLIQQSEASYVYILSGQKLIKNAKNGQFGEFLKT